jgi:hypothetical protein
MRHKYYENIKNIFFGVPNAEKYVEGIEYLVSEQAVLDAQILARQKNILNVEESKALDESDLMDVDNDDLRSPVSATVNEDILAAAYVIHKNFIAKFFQLNDSHNNPELLNRFATAYTALLENFLSLSDEHTQETKFKQIAMDLLNSISIYDTSNEVALTLALKIVNCDLPAEFCLAALMQVKVDAGTESQQKVMSILNILYSKDSVWNGASTPSVALSVTPSTPQTMAALMYSTALTGHYSKHAHQGNIAFLFHMQACWFTAGNMIGCKFIDKCLPAAVLSLNEYKNKIPEWQWVLKTLEKYPEGSMQRRWRNRIVQNIRQWYGDSPEMLTSLGVKPKHCWTWLFSACSSDEYLLDEYEPKAVVKGRPFTLTS